jgi:nuclear transport factor 2 (NTF2) superfamily protein
MTIIEPPFTLESATQKFEWRDPSAINFAPTETRTGNYDAAGLMQRRIDRINDLPIKEADRKLSLASRAAPTRHPRVTEGERHEGSYLSH